MTTIVSYSEVFKWQTCQRQYYYRFILGRSPTTESNAISTGVQGHKLLQIFYELIREGKNKDEALALTQSKAKHVINSEKTIDYNLLKAWTLIDNYIRESDFTNEIILIENRFLLPASLIDNDPAVDSISIGFTPDVVFKRPGGMIDIEDAKFVGRAWTGSKLNRFSQAKLYQIFMEAMGYNISRTSIRFFNTTTGRINVKYYTMDKVEKKILIHDFMPAVKEVARYKNASEDVHRLAPRTMNYTACQYCPFEFPCTLEAEGKDATKTLTSQYTESKYDYTK